MKFFFSPGACSLASHIILNELDMAYTPEKVDLKAHTYSGGDYYKVTAKGQVPCLVTDKNETFTEGPVIMQYLVDQKPETTLAPRYGTTERYHLNESLNYLTSEIHKSFAPIFHPAMLAPTEATAAVREKAVEHLMKRFEYVNQKFGKNDFFTGNHFTIADAYLFVMVQWTKKLKLDMAKFPAIMAFSERVLARPAVQKTMKQEGLIA
jgi:glutathione S-transferase